MKEYIDMKQYGLTENFQSEVNKYKNLSVARILSQEKGLYRIVSSQGKKLAEISGKFQFKTARVSDYPAVGDFVMVNWNPSGNSAIIEYVLPRKSSFTRKAAGDTQQEQVVAANIDTVFICMALNNDFNLRRLERCI